MKLKYVLLVMILTASYTADAQKIYKVQYESQADLKIYIVDYSSQAGWRNKEKSHLMI